jgi:hypothetical protein
MVRNMADDDEEKSDKKENDNDKPPVAESAADRISPPPAMPPPPPYGPPPQHYPPPSGPFNPGNLATNKILFPMILLGVILLLIGSILIAYAPTIYDAKEDNQDDRDDNTERMQNTRMAGNTMFNLGVFFLGFFLILAGAFREDLNNYVRLGLLIAAGLILTNFIAF